MKRGYACVLIVCLAVLFAWLACCTMPTAPAKGPATDSTLFSVENDAARNLVMLIDAEGNRIDVQGEEEDGTIVACTEAVSVLALAGEGLSPKGLAGQGLSWKGLAGKTAMVLGKRSDGRPGVWIVHPDKKIDTLVSEETGKLSSCLPDSDEKDGCFRGKFGWTYTIMGVSEDGKIIIGYAKTEKGFSWHGHSVDPGTTVGVYWRVWKYRGGKHYMVSRARIIGIFDPTALPTPDKKHRHWTGWLQLHWLDHLKWFLLDYLTSYLIMVEKDGVSYDEALQLYLVRGTDQEGRPAIARIGERGVVAIEPVVSDGAPDLQPGVMSFKDSAVADGANLKVSLEVENLKSAAVSASFQVHFYLASTSDFPLSTEADLGEVTVNGGVPGGSSVTVEAVLPNPVPELDVNKARYVYAVVDSTELIEESDENNNQSTADTAAVVLVYDDENPPSSYGLIVETYAPTGSGSVDTLMALYKDDAGTAKFLMADTGVSDGYAALNGGVAVALDAGKTYYVVVLMWATEQLREGPYALAVRTENIDRRTYTNLTSDPEDPGELDDTPKVWLITKDTSLPTAPMLIQAGNSANCYSAELDWDWFTFKLP